MFGSQTAVAQRAARECGRCKKQNDGFPFAREKLLRTKREPVSCGTSPSPTMEQHSDFRFVVMIRNLGWGTWSFTRWFWILVGCIMSISLLSIIVKCSIARRKRTGHLPVIYQTCPAPSVKIGTPTRI